MTAVAHPATPIRVRTWWIMPTLAAALVVAGVWWSLAPYMVGVFHDDGVYALLARSIAEGNGFHYSHLPGAPAATHYPPLYPLLLATLWRIAPDFPANLGALLGLNAVLAGMAAAGWWMFAVRQLEWRAGVAAVAAVVLAMTTPMLTLAGALLSEMLFIALLWPVLLLTERALDAEDTRTSLGAGAAIGALMLVRTHAVALLFAVIVLAIARRRPRHGMAMFLAAAAVQLPWLAWTTVATPRVAAPLEGAYGSYIGWFVNGLREGGAGFALDTARLNLRELGLLLRDRFVTGVAAVDALALLLSIAAGLGGALSLARRAPVALLFAAAYFAIVVVWPYAPWRFAWAAWPLVIMMMIEGVRTLWIRSPGSRYIAVAAALLPVVALLRTELHSYASRGWRAPARSAAAQLVPVVDWARANSSPDDVLLVEGEQVVALYANRRAAPPVSFTALEYVRPRGEGTAASLSAMLHAVPASLLVSIAPDVQRAALALRDSVIVLEQQPAPRGLTAFVVRR